MIECFRGSCGLYYWYWYWYWYCTRSIALRVSSPGRRIPRLLRPERLCYGCSYRRLFLAARAIMVSEICVARDPRALGLFRSCSRYRRRLERGRRTTGGVIFWRERLGAGIYRLLGPLLYIGLEALAVYLLRHYRSSQVIRSHVT